MERTEGMRLMQGYSGFTESLLQQTISMAVQKHKRTCLIGTISNIQK